ncbi:M23 family metallopeptidase [Dactylosporangium sp. NPDC005572]|uniref:M23 family metallopeptidase n=1 Tax=Dactylosporangium sp. NPDC005572 TaxID=3156889 RepID=UPI0033A5E011
MIGMVTIVQSRGRRGWRRRIALVVGGAALVLVLVVAGGAVWVLWPAGPRPLFQLPVKCGETWQLGTYPGHGDYDVDFFPMKGPAWGQPVLASFAGKVVAAGVSGSLGGRTPDNPKGARGSGGGYWVKIDHGGRWSTQYLHLLEPPMVQSGQRVTQGQQLGKVGSTGDSGAPHLHYEQRRGLMKVETYFNGGPSGITTDDREYTITVKSNNCP